jgi:hypothetical protein
MNKLLAWAHEPRRLSIRFVHGPGGTGRTRLAAELATRLAGERRPWMAGFTPLERPSRLPLGANGLLAILDYPEAWHEQVRTLLREAARIHQPAAPLRILLLSRRPMDDWQSEIIDCGASHLCSAQEITIGPLALVAATTLFRTVVARLSSERHLSPPVINDGELADWMARRPELHLLPLITIAAAVHYALEPRATLGLDAAAIVAALVERERKVIDGIGRAAGWGESGASRLFALAALREDGLDESAIRCLAEPSLELGFPEGSPLDAVRGLGVWRDEHLRAPQPDIMAAELLSACCWMAATAPQNGRGRL